MSSVTLLPVCMLPCECSLPSWLVPVESISKPHHHPCASGDATVVSLQPVLPCVWPGTWCSSTISLGGCRIQQMGGGTALTS